MTTKTKDLETAARDALNEVRALGQETRLKVHLASMDAKVAWTRIEPKLAQAERDALEVSSTALHRIQETAANLREFLASL
ncbi:MAG TPA: hypothetical protein VGI39_06845 [Polyangiaceae bacterium]|jgi:hypothetical protein